MANYFDQFDPSEEERKKGNFFDQFDTAKKEEPSANFFDQFDIDYNKEKYLIETRISGGLTKIRSAVIIRIAASGAVKVTPVWL